VSDHRFLPFNDNFSNYSRFYDDFKLFANFLSEKIYSVAATHTKNLFFVKKLDIDSIQ